VNASARTSFRVEFRSKLLRPTVGHYLDDLLALDDLFTLSYYSPSDPEAICADPNENGWICGSHIVLLHRDQILDPASGVRTSARDHKGRGRFTKRIFRVVPAQHLRGL
jgi:hypothetical protein